MPKRCAECLYWPTAEHVAALLPPRAYWAACVGLRLTALYRSARGVRLGAGRAKGSVWRPRQVPGREPAGANHLNNGAAAGTIPALR